MYTAEKLPKKTKNFNPSPVSINTIHHQNAGSHQSKYLSSLLPGLPASNQQQLIHSTNRIISQQQQQQISKSKFSKQIIYHPKTVQVPASSSSISIAQLHTPIASTPSSSTVSNDLQKQEKVTHESERVRTKESSPEEEEINVTEIEEKIEIKEEEKEKNKNVKSYHAPQTDILFKVKADLNLFF